MIYIVLAQAFTGLFGILFSYIYSNSLSLLEIATLSEYLLLINIILGVTNSMSDREYYANTRYKINLNPNSRFLYDVLFSLIMSTLVLLTAFELGQVNINIMLFGLLIFYHPVQKLRINFEVNSSLAFSRYPIIFSSVIISILLLGLYFVEALNFQSLLLIRFSVFYVEILLACVLHMPKVGLFRSEIQSLDRNYLKITLPLIAANLFVIVYSNIDYFFVKAMFSAEEFGAYFFIFNLYTQFLIIRRIIVAYVYPKLVTTGRFDIRSKKFKKLIYGATILTIPASFLHDWMVANYAVVILGDKWQPYLSLFNINFVILYERLLYSFFEPYFVSTKRTSLILINTLMSIGIMFFMLGFLYLYGASLVKIATVTLLTFVVPSLITLVLDLKRDVLFILATTLLRILVYGAIFFNI